MNLESQIELNGLQINIQDFPVLVEIHLWNCGGTSLLEDEGSRLRSTPLTDYNLRNFVLCAHMWGGDRYNNSKEIYDPKHNSLEELRTHFREAIQILNSLPVSVSDALKELNKIKYLGGTSLASKHLRLLCPEFCPVLDSKITGEFGYSEDTMGYGRYAADCVEIARKLESLQVINPRQRPSGKWYAGDIDMALFAWVQEWGKPI